jgi:hypothetical protein
MNLRLHYNVSTFLTQIITVFQHASEYSLIGYVVIYNELRNTEWTGRPGFDPRQRQRIFLPVSASRPTLGPTQPLIQWVPGGKSWPGRDADHSPPSSAEVKNE